ncbi:MAG: type I asparaginase [Rikenellaceae bacterium]
MGVLIIYTGGTIGMKTNPESGALAPFNFSEIEKEVPELRKFGVSISTYTFSPTIDSSNVLPEHWGALARIIKENYDLYDGFVVLHGTDTMSYTASALSFMLQNLDKAVVFTGSQIPIGVLRTDGKENLITAVEIASSLVGGKSVVPEVTIFFHNQLFRANRTTKHSAEYLNAFCSHNYPVLASAGIDINYNHNYIRKVDSFLPSFDIQQNMCSDVTILRIFPGITQKVVNSILSAEGIKGVILESYGSGNAPQHEWFFEELSEAIDRGVVIVNITQCSEGRVNMELYDTGKRLGKIGVISGEDLTVESALTKLMFLLAQELPHKVLLERLVEPLRGEMSC